MTEAFRQYIKIRTFLGYRPKEIHVELQNALGDEAPNYANVQRWSKRYRDAVDSPLGSPLSSQVKFETQQSDFNQQIDGSTLNEDSDNFQIQRQINANAKQSKSTRRTYGKGRSKIFMRTRSSTRSIAHQ